MLTVGLQAVFEIQTAANVGKITKAATIFGANVLSPGNLKYKWVKAPKYQSGKYSAKH